MFLFKTKKKVFHIVNKGVTVTPIIWENTPGKPDDLKIKYGAKVTIPWQMFFGWVGKLFGCRKREDKK